MAEFTDCDTCDGTGYMPIFPTEKVGAGSFRHPLFPCPDCNEEIT